MQIRSCFIIGNHSLFLFIFVFVLRDISAIKCVFAFDGLHGKALNANTNIIIFPFFVFSYCFFCAMMYIGIQFMQAIKLQVYLVIENAFKRTVNLYIGRITNN